MDTSILQKAEEKIFRVLRQIKGMYTEDETSLRQFVEATMIDATIGRAHALALVITRSRSFRP